MYHLNNDTPFAAQIFLLPDQHGIDTLYLLIKATFDLLPGLRLAERQQPVFTEDIYCAEPGQSSLKYPSELHLEKPGTDVIVVGDAIAPNERPVTMLDVSLSVAGRICLLKVFGDRLWKKGFLNLEPGSPRPFIRMPVVYERAYGGMQVIDEASGDILMEDRNPVGKGFRGSRTERDYEAVALPNIEDPANLIKKPSDQPAPAGFGAIAPYWQPRVSRAGTCDESWQKTRAPYLPEDFDLRFYQAAHPGLIFNGYLKGGEPVKIINMSLRGRQHFNLPKDKPKVEVDITGRSETVKTKLETVLLEPTDETISLTWRAFARSGNKISGARVNVTL